MPTRDEPMVVRDFLGLNRRDGADKVLDNQFFKLQNFYPKTKGLLYKREGSTNEQLASGLSLVASIAGFYRYMNQIAERSTIYYCEPDGTTIATPAAPPTVASIADGTGDLFNGGAVAARTFHYSWVGKGYETALSPGTAITVGANTDYVQVQLPAFPAGVVSANVFITAGAAEYVYVGTVYTSAGTLNVKQFTATNLAYGDPTGTLTELSQIAGTLKRGSYYISACWATKPMAAGVAHGPQLAVTAPGVTPAADTYIVARVTEDNKGLRVYMNKAAASTNGATWLYFFIGLKPPTEGPMLFVGAKKYYNGSIGFDASTASFDNNILEITSLPVNTNAQSTPVNTGTANEAAFEVNATDKILYPATATTWLSSVLGRGAFLVKKSSSGTTTEIQFSRSQYSFNFRLIDPLTGAAIPSLATAIVNNQKYKVETGGTPIFSTLSGECYIANGKQLILQTDGYTLGGIVEKFGTSQPGFADYVSTFKGQLICTVPGYANQLFGTNSFQPNNWASGGTGTALRFVTVGDPFGDGVKVVSIFSFTSGTEGPKSFIFSAKKNSCWVYSSIPDLTSGVPFSMDQLSGKIGSISPLAAAPTPIGLVFLGSDGDVYLTRGSGEPYRIGSTIQPLLAHLLASDTLMAKCSAVYHDGFYKLSYPSSADSTGNDAQLWADLRTDGGQPIVWSGPHTGIGVGLQQVFSSEGDNSRRYGLKADNSSVIYLDDTSTFQDLGVTITSIIETKTYRMRAHMHWKRLMSIVLDAYYDSQYDHTITHEAFMDDQYSQYEHELSIGGGTWDSSAWDAGLWTDAMFNALPWYIGPTPLIGRTLQYRLTHANNAQFILAAIGATIQPERRQITI